MVDVSRARELCEQIVAEVASVFVGNRLLVVKLLAAALADGHVLFEDYPGLGKTLLTQVFARVIGCQFNRIQFTPDLLPADILGAKMWQQSDACFLLMKGPIFTNVLLADEINRASPKTQSALLEAMAERQVTIEGERYVLESPFLVLATQNPIELEGTFPLPEAQMDRFLLRLSIGYPQSVQEESTILSRRVAWQRDDPTQGIKPLLSAARFRELQQSLENDIYVDKRILDYISEIIRETREHPAVEIGSSPRGGLALLKMGRAMALINGRDFVTPDDVKISVVDALAHRLILNMESTVDDVDRARIVEEIVDGVTPPKEFQPR